DAPKSSARPTDANIESGHALVHSKSNPGPPGAHAFAASWRTEASATAASTGGLGTALDAASATPESASGGAGAASPLDAGAARTKSEHATCPIAATRIANKTMRCIAPWYARTLAGSLAGAVRH